MKQKIIDSIMEYRESLKEKGLEKASGRHILSRFLSYDHQYKIIGKESKDIDEAFDYFAENGIYEISDMFFDYAYRGYAAQDFRYTTDRWEHAFPKMLDYQETKLEQKSLVQYMGKCYRKNYFDMKFLVDNFENAKEYANKSMVCAQTMYQKTQDEKYLRFARTLALRKLFARIATQASIFIDRSNRQKDLADHIYGVIRPHLPFESLNLVNEGLEVLEDRGSVDQVFATVKETIKKIYLGRSYMNLDDHDFGPELENKFKNVNYIKDPEIDLINEVGVRWGLFADGSQEKIDGRYYDMVESRHEIDYMQADDDRLIIEILCNFEEIRYMTVRLENSLAAFLFEMVVEKRLGQAMEKLSGALKKIGQYEDCGGYGRRYKHDSLLCAFENFDFEKNMIVLPENDGSREIYNLFLLMEYAKTGEYKSSETDNLMVDNFDQIHNLIPHSYCHDSIYLRVMEEHLEKLYGFIGTADEGKINRMLSIVKSDEKKVGYLLATKIKKLNKKIKEAVYNLEDPAKAFEIEPIDKEHQKAIDALKSEYEIISDRKLGDKINEIAKNEIKAAALKKYSWMDMDSLSLKLGGTKLSKEAAAYLFKMIESGIVEELPKAYDNIISAISSENPKKDYENLIESYKAKGFKPNHRFILYFCKALLDADTLYRMSEDTKNEKISKSIAVTYIDVYKFKSTGSELEVLIDLAAKSKNKEIVKHAKKQIRNIRSSQNINIIDFNRMELSTNSLMKEGGLEFVHSSGMLEARIGKKNKLEFLLDGQAVKRLPSAKTEDDKVIKDRINALKKEMKRVEDKFESYLKNLFNLNIKLSKAELDEIIKYPLAKKFIHSLFFKCNDCIFTIDESNDFIDLDYEEVDISKEDRVKLISNLELSGEEIEAIKEYMSDNKLADEIGQFSISDIDLKGKYDLDDQEVNYISINNKLEEMGFVLSGEEYRLELDGDTQITIWAYLGSVSDTYKMTLYQIETQGESSVLKRMMNALSNIGIEIKN